MTTDEIVEWANGQWLGTTPVVHPRSYAALNREAPACKCGKKTKLFSRWVPDEDRALEVLATGVVVSEETFDGIAIPTDVYQCECGLYTAVDLSPPPSEEVRKFLAEYYDGVNLFGGK